MPSEINLSEIIIILAAAVGALLVLQRMKLSPVLGYLIAGVLVGPFGLKFVSDVRSIHAIAEFGVVFLLFSIGLELPLKRLEVLSPSLCGLGVAQILVTGLAFGGLAALSGVPLEAAIVIGAALALSSTVFVIQILIDRRQLATRFGRAAFAVLLMQDLAIAPILVITLALMNREAALATSLGVAGLKALAAFAVIILIGRYVLQPVFRFVAATRSQQTFAATTLLVVLCTAALTDLAGLSLAVGGLLAGMILAETQYRHQVAAEIQPFRGLLLGLFFMSIGMETDLGVAFARLGTVAGVTAGLILTKALILGVLALAFRLPALHAWPLGLLLAQGGEFAFVIFNTAMGGGILEPALGQTLTVAVAFSMMLTPVLAWTSADLARRVAIRASVSVEELAEEADELRDHVVIAGYGRVGSTIAREMEASGIPFVALDLDPDEVARARARGERVFFGDASRPDTLELLQVASARAVVVALSNAEAATRMVGMLHYILPECSILARAENEVHAAELTEAGATIVVPELIATGKRLAAHITGGDDAGP